MPAVKEGAVGRGDWCFRTSHFSILFHFLVFFWWFSQQLLAAVNLSSKLCVQQYMFIYSDSLLTFILILLYQKK